MGVGEIGARRQAITRRTDGKRIPIQRFVVAPTLQIHPAINLQQAAGRAGGGLRDCRQDSNGDNSEPGQPQKS